MSNFLQVLIDGILSGLLYALVAAGLSMMWGVMDVINFAHGEFLMVAMYLCYWIGAILGIDPLFSWIASGIFLFFMGALTYKIIIKNSLGKAAMAPLLATFGLSMLLKNFCMNRFTPNFRLLSGTIMEGKTFEVAGAIISLPQLVTAIFSLVVLLGVYWLIKKTRVGWAIQATAMDKEAAELMGIDTENIYLLVFGIGGACVGVAGGLMTTYLAVHPKSAGSSALSHLWSLRSEVSGVSPELSLPLLIGLVESFAGFYVAAVVKYVAVFAISCCYSDKTKGSVWVVTAMLIKDKSDKLWYGFLAVAVVLPFIPGVIGGSFFGHVATMILLYAAMAQSWNIISGYCGQTSFGHSVFFGIGAYAASLAVVTFESLPWYGVPLGMLVAAVVSIVIIILL